MVGSARCVALARECGVEVEGALCPPRAAPWAARDLLRRFINAKAAGGVAYDLIHAWTARTAALVAAVWKNRPSVASFHVGPRATLSASYALRAISGAPNQSLLAASTAVSREFRARGIGKARLTLMPPAIDPQCDQMPQRQEIRRAWAEDSDLQFNDDDFVVGLLAEPVTWVDIRTAVTIVCRARLAGRRVRLLAAPDAGTVGTRVEGQRMMRQLSLDEMMIVDAATQPWRIARGFDAALVLGSGSRARPASSCLPLLWALAAGVPCIAESSDGMGDMVEDGVSGWLIHPGDVNAAAERIVRMYDDRNLAATIGENGRHLVCDTFNIHEYCIRLQHAYELLLADRTVRTLMVPPGDAELHAETAAVA